MSVSQFSKAISHLVSQQISHHFCVASGCSQVERCHLVLVGVCEAKHARFPQVVHCNTGVRGWGRVGGAKLVRTLPFQKVIPAASAIPPPLTCCPQSLHDAWTFSLADPRGAGRLRTASFGA